MMTQGLLMDAFVGIRYLTPDTWHLAPDTWHLTPDT